MTNLSRRTFFQRLGAIFSGVLASWRSVARPWFSLGYGERTFTSTLRDTETTRDMLRRYVETKSDG